MSSEARRLAQEIAQMKRDVRALQTATRVGHSSIEGGSLPVFDDNGDLRLVFGLQDDGTYSSAAFGGDPAPVPSTPTLSAGVASFEVSWDGEAVDGSAWPANFDRVDVHVSTTPDFVVDNTTLWHSFHGLGAERALLMAAPGSTYYVKFVAVTESNVGSVPSAEASVTPDAVVTQADLDVIDGRLDDAEAAVADKVEVLVAAARPTVTAEDRVYWLDDDNGFASEYWDGTSWTPWAYGTAALAAGSVVAGTIAAGAVETQHLVADAVQAGQIAADAVTAREIAALSITSDELAANAVTAGKVAAGAIEAGSLAAGAVVAGNIEAGAVDAAAIAANAVTADSIAADAINGMTITGATVQSGPVGAERVALQTNPLFPSGHVEGVYGYTGASDERDPGVLQWFPAWSDKARLYLAGVSTAYQQDSTALDAPALFLDTPRTSAEPGLAWVISERIKLDSRDSATNASVNSITLDPNSWNSVAIIGETTITGRVDTTVGTAITRSELFVDNDNAMLAFHTDHPVDSERYYVMVSADRAELASVNATNNYQSYLRAEATGVEIYGSTVIGGDLSVTANIFLDGQVQAENEIHTNVGGTAGGLFDDVWIGGGGTAARINTNGRIIRGTSSQRYKHSIEPIPLETAKNVLALEPVSFLWNDDQNMGDRRYPGFIAEQVEAAGMGLWVSYDKDGRADGIHYAELTTALVALVKDLTDRVEVLETAAGLS